MPRAHVRALSLTLTTLAVLAAGLTATPASAANGLDITWPTKKGPLVATKLAPLTGAVPTADGTRRTVRLQRYAGAGKYKTLASTTTTRVGNFELRFPDKTPSGQGTYRVHAPTQGRLGVYESQWQGTFASIKRKVTTKLTKKTVRAGDKVLVRGRVQGATGRQTIKVGFKLPGGGVTYLLSTRTAKDGTYKAKVNTEWAAKSRVVVTATATSTQPETSSWTTLKVKKTTKSRGSSKSHSMLLKGAAWNPCEVIKYRLNTKRAPRGSVDDVKKSFKRVTAASGLRFKYSGKTNYLPFAKSQYRSKRPKGGIVIGWGTPKQAEGIEGSTIGRGGFSVNSSTTNGRGKKVMTIAQGNIIIDSSENLRGRYGARGHQSLLMHEIGHALGLGHVNDRTQIMNPVLQPKINEFGSGDIAGLTKVGASAGCHTP